MGNTVSLKIRQALEEQRDQKKLEGPLLPTFEGPLTPRPEIRLRTNRINETQEKNTATNVTNQNQQSPSWREKENKMISKVMCCAFSGTKRIRDHFVHSSIGDRIRSFTQSTINSNESPAIKSRVYPSNITLLYGTTNIEEHYEKVDLTVTLANSLKGNEGLRILGFHYRQDFDIKNETKVVDEVSLTPEQNNKHGSNITSCTMNESNFKSVDLNLCETGKILPINQSEKDMKLNNESLSATTRSTLFESESEREASIYEDNITSLATQESMNHEASLSGFVEDDTTRKFSTRLYHIQSKTFITEQNRKKYIANGEMYEQIARLCQEAAQEVMISEGNLEWVTICDDKKLGSEPIRALVSKSFVKRRDDNEDDCECNCIPQDIHLNESSVSSKTMLIITGKGKVRAGIFSRQHLITTGVEAGTALPHIREANKRNMSVVILDPNARGDRQGMMTFEKSLNKLFCVDINQNSDEQLYQNEMPQLSPKSLYVLAHSQGGAQLVRFFRDSSSLLPKIGAIAFTDSTHNVQWVKENKYLRSLLESEICMYLKSANPKHDDDWDKRTAGELVDTDHYWEHRFGKVKTLWAGTKEHSLTNWVALKCICDHFDEFLDRPLC